MLKTLAIVAILSLGTQTPAIPQSNSRSVTPIKTIQDGENPTPPTPPVLQNQTHSDLAPKADKGQEQDQRDKSAIGIAETAPPVWRRREWIAYFANLALALIAFFGIVAAFKTLRKLERQTKATESAANTASKDLALSNRAYIGARIDKYMVEIGRPLNVSVIFENKGKTPAYKVRTCQVTRLIRRGEGTIITYPEERWSPGFSIIMPDGHTSRLGNAVGSDNEPRITPDGLLTRDLHESVRTNELSPITYGQIQYEDIFGVPHWTTFCFNMLMLPPIQGIGDAPAWGPSPVGNDMDKNQEQPSKEDQPTKRWWYFWRKATNPN